MVFVEQKEMFCSFGGDVGSGHPIQRPNLAWALKKKRAENLSTSFTMEGFMVYCIVSNFCWKSSVCVMNTVYEQCPITVSGVAIAKGVGQVCVREGGSFQGQAHNWQPSPLSANHRDTTA